MAAKKKGSVKKIVTVAPEAQPGKVKPVTKKAAPALKPAKKVVSAAAPAAQPEAKPNEKGHKVWQH